MYISVRSCLSVCTYLCSGSCFLHVYVSLRTVICVYSSLPCYFVRMCLWRCAFVYTSLGMLLFLSTHLGDVSLCVSTCLPAYISLQIFFYVYINSLQIFFLCVHVLRDTSLLVCTCLLGCLCACQVSCTGEHVSVGHIRVFPRGC